MRFLVNFNMEFIVKSYRIFTLSNIFMNVLCEVSHRD